MSTRPAQTFVQHSVCTIPPHPIGKRRSLAKGGLALAILCLVVFAAGCNVNGNGLSSNLPSTSGSGGSGAFKFISASTVAATGIAGRTYAKVFVTSLKTTIYPISLANTSGTGGTAPIFCSVASGALPPGMSSPAVDSTGAGCQITGTPTTAGTYTFTVQATDSSNPPNSPTQSFTVTVVADKFTIALGSGLTTPLPQGVQTRTYGAINPAAMTMTLTADAGNSSSISCAVTGAPLAATASGATCTLAKASTGFVAGTYTNVAASMTDGTSTDAETNLQAVGAETKQAFSGNTLVVNAPLVVTPASLAAAVVGRAYGIGTCLGSACQPANFSVSGGLGGPSGVGPYGELSIVGPGAWACSLAAPTTFGCTTAAVGGGGPANLTLTVTDPGDAATPAASAATDPNSVASGGLNTQGPVVVTPSLGMTWPDGVTGRAYAIGATKDQFSVAGGISPYNFPATTPASFPAGFTCAAASPLYVCSASPITAPQGAFAPALTVTDTGNTSTPASTLATDSMSQTVDALTVDAPLALAFTGPAGGPFAGVNGRVYGTGNGCAPTSACSALTFGITGGVSSGYAAPTITSQPGAWNCTLAAATYSCSSGALSNASTSTFTLAANDNGNSVVPAGTSTAVSEALTIDGAMNLAAVSTSPLPQGVTGRSYGTGGTCSPLPACAPVQYHVTGGLGTYQAPTAALGASDTFTCTVGATYSCFTNVINGGAGSPTLTSTVQDVANQSSPSGQATNSSLLITIQAPITVTPEQTSWPTAVVGRSYGMLGTPQNFDATGGISPYVSFVPVGGSFPGTFTCTPSTPSGSPGQCSSATITGIAGTPYAPEVTAKDTGSQSAPPGTGTSSNIASVAVSPALQITTTTLPNALVAYPYPNPATPTASTLAATGGVVGTYTWLGPGAVSCTVAPAGTLPSNITLSAAGELAGTPATASATDTQFTFDVCVSDAGNSMVPAGNVTSGNYTVNVLNTFAYVAEPNVPQVEVVNTTTKAAVSQIALTSGTGPSNVAISPNGARAYVTLGDTNALAVIDTITNTLSSTHSIAGCIAPQGVAATATLIYVACTGSNTVAVLNATTFAATTTITPPAGGNPIGVAIRSDNARVYVTLSGLNRILIIDNTQSPPVAIAMTALDSGNGNVPMGIALAPSGGKTYAYIAKQEGTASNPGIDVFDVTTDTPGSVVSIALSASPTLEVPEFVAATPDFGRVYVSLQGTGAVAVVTNATTPALLNRVALASGASPEGIAIPPLISPPGTGLFVYVSDFNNNNLALIDNASTPALDAGSPVALTAASAPDGIAAIPVPQ